jgi:hypothetical protein
MPETDLHLFIEQCRKGLAHQVSGDTGPKCALWSDADDAVIMGAFGVYGQGGATAGVLTLGSPDLGINSRAELKAALEGPD